MSLSLTKKSAYHYYSRVHACGDATAHTHTPYTHKHTSPKPLVCYYSVYVWKLNLNHLRKYRKHVSFVSFSLP